MRVGTRTCVTLLDKFFITRAPAFLANRSICSRPNPQRINETKTDEKIELHTAEQTCLVVDSFHYQDNV